MRNAVFVVVFFSFACSAFASDPAPAERLAAIKKDVADALTKFQTANIAKGDPMKDDPHVDALYAIFDKKDDAGIATAMEIAKTDPKSDVAFDALTWVVAQDFQSKTGGEATKLLAEFHAANPRVGGTVAYLAHYIHYLKLPVYEPAGELMNAVIKSNLNRDAKAQAESGLAQRLKLQADMAQFIATPDREELAARAATAIQKVIAEYGDCPNLRLLNDGTRVTGTVADDLNPQLFELQHLEIGHLAPDIAADDLNGVPFKLSDARGKVVMLVFWASWCGPCMAEVPHENEIAARLRNRPFILIGVNGDEDKNKAADAVARTQITWRSFWNGKNGPDSSIAAAWNVRGWPTIYVIDQSGKIRYKYIIGKEIDTALDQLLSETPPPKS